MVDIMSIYFGSGVIRAATNIWYKKNKKEYAIKYVNILTKEEKKRRKNKGKIEEGKKEGRSRDGRIFLTIAPCSFSL